MDDQMLRAAQEAAWAGQSAAEAAWWGLLINGAAAVGAVGALWFALIQGFKNGRFERLRMGAICNNLATEIDALFSCYVQGEPAKKNAQFVKRSGVLRRLRAAVALAQTQAIPDARAQADLGTVLMTVDFIEADIERGGDGAGNLSELDDIAEHYRRLSFVYLGREHPEPWMDKRH